MSYISSINYDEFIKKLKIYSSGTTTVGLVTNNGVVLATDRRVTSGFYIAHRRGKKIWKIDDHVAATMSGAVADVQKILDYLTRIAASYKVETGRPILIKSLVNYASMILFSSRPFIYIAHMIFGGWDPEEGPILYTIDWFGTTTRETEFTATGSGSSIAFGVLEDGYRRDMSIDEAIKLAIRAVKAAIRRDPGSGEGVDVVVVTKEGYREVENVDLSIV